MHLEWCVPSLSHLEIPQTVLSSIVSSMMTSGAYSHNLDTLGWVPAPAQEAPLAVMHSHDMVEQKGGN
eukprot:3733270-Lingulodinium_polyedra.AAC.1